MRSGGAFCSKGSRRSTTSLEIVRIRGGTAVVSFPNHQEGAAVAYDDADVCFILVPKVGTTSLKSLRKGAKLTTVARCVRRKQTIVAFIRDPISRFVSAFHEVEFRHQMELDPERTLRTLRTQHIDEHLCPQVILLQPGGFRIEDIDVLRRLDDMNATLRELGFKPIEKRISTRTSSFEWARKRCERHRRTIEMVYARDIALYEGTPSL